MTTDEADENMRKITGYRRAGWEIGQENPRFALKCLVLGVRARSEQIERPLLVLFDGRLVPPVFRLSGQSAD